MPNKPQWYEFNPNPKKTFVYLFLPVIVIFLLSLFASATESICRNLWDRSGNSQIVDLVCTISVMKAQLLYAFAVLLAG
jgi:membrane-anchored protein YejM (alkaline phosphatase superfamily)